MPENDTEYYKLSYLIRAYGGLHKVFFSKNSWDFYISIVVTGFSLHFYKFTFPTSSQILFVVGLDVALLGLILATYAITFSIQDKVFLRALVESNNYQYLLFQTTWTTMWIFASIGLLAVLVFLHFSIYEVTFAIFFTIYGFLGVVVIVAFNLRKYAVMSSRSTKELRDAWKKP